MWHAREAQRVEVGERLSRSYRVQSCARTESAQHRRNFQIDQLGSAEMLTAQSVAGTPPIIAIVDQGCCQNTRVDNDHLASRSERTARAASAALRLPPLWCSMRSNTSMSVGVSASSRSRASRYSCSD